MENNKKITIMDVAKLAGVSKGTVDRVVHNRGEVSKKSEEKVKKVVKELGYEPNIYASMLASKKAHTIYCLLPQFEKGEYWDLVYNGIERGIEYAKTFNVKVETILFDQYSIDSYRDACKELLKKKPSGVIIPPLFKNDTYNLTNELIDNKVPYIYIDSKLEDDSYFAYFGMPMYQSGYLCADLLTSSQTNKDIRDVAIIRIVRDKYRQSDPTINRREGFMEYMAEHYPQCELHNIFINPQNPKDILSSLDDFFTKHSNVKNIVTFNSRVYLVTNYLEKHKMSGCRVIGFDNLSKNIDALRAGVITTLITQHTEEQTFLAIQALIDLFVLKKKPAKKDNYMHMDILTRLNVDYY